MKEPSTTEDLKCQSSQFKGDGGSNGSKSEELNEDSALSEKGFACPESSVEVVGLKRKAEDQPTSWGDTTETCSICFDSIHIKGRIPCDHAFCFPCIFKWAKTENSCPLCKKKFQYINKYNPSKKATKGGLVPAPEKVKISERSQAQDFAPPTFSFFPELANHPSIYELMGIGDPLFSMSDTETEESETEGGTDWYEDTGRSPTWIRRHRLRRSSSPPPLNLDGTQISNAMVMDDPALLPPRTRRRRVMASLPRVVPSRNLVGLSGVSAHQYAEDLGELLAFSRRLRRGQNGELEFAARPERLNLPPREQRPVPEANSSQGDDYFPMAGASGICPYASASSHGHGHRLRPHAGRPPLHPPTASQSHGANGADPILNRSSASTPGGSRLMLSSSSSAAPRNGPYHCLYATYPSPPPVPPPHQEPLHPAVAQQAFVPFQYPPLPSAARTATHPLPPPEYWPGPLAGRPAVMSYAGTHVPPPPAAAAASSATSTGSRNPSSLDEETFAEEFSSNPALVEAVQRGGAEILNEERFLPSTLHSSEFLARRGRSRRNTEEMMLSVMSDTTSSLYELDRLLEASRLRLRSSSLSSSRARPTVASSTRARTSFSMEVDNPRCGSSQPGEMGMSSENPIHLSDDDASGPAKSSTKAEDSSKSEEREDGKMEGGASREGSDEVVEISPPEVETGADESANEGHSSGSEDGAEGGFGLGLRGMYRPDQPNLYEEVAASRRRARRRIRQLRRARRLSVRAEHLSRPISRRSHRRPYWPVAQGAHLETGYDRPRPVRARTAPETLYELLGPADLPSDLDSPTHSMDDSHSSAGEPAYTHLLEPAIGQIHTYGNGLQRGYSPPPMPTFTPPPPTILPEDESSRTASVEKAEERFTRFVGPDGYFHMTGSPRISRNARRSGERSSTQNNANDSAVVQGDQKCPSSREDGSSQGLTNAENQEEDRKISADLEQVEGDPQDRQPNVKVAPRQESEACKNETFGVAATDRGAQASFTGLSQPVMISPPELQLPFPQMELSRRRRLGDHRSARQRSHPHLHHHGMTVVPMVVATPSMPMVAPAYPVMPTTTGALLYERAPFYGVGVGTLPLPVPVAVGSPRFQVVANSPGSMGPPPHPPYVTGVARAPPAGASEFQSPLPRPRGGGVDVVGLSITETGSGSNRRPLTAEEVRTPSPTLQAAYSHHPAEAPFLSLARAHSAIQPRASKKDEGQKDSS